MADNPLENTAAREARIRQRAYHLWEADGRPHGREQEYWERAEFLTGIEDSAGAGQLPNPQNTHEPVPGVTVEEAAIQDNYGEFPDRLTDQGTRQQTPKPRVRKAKAPAKRGGSA